CASFLLCGYCARLDLRSFPTRRSSDLFPPCICRPLPLWVLSATVLSGAVPGGRLSAPVRLSVAFRAEWCQSTCSGLRHIPLFCPDRKSTRLNSSHVKISYAVFCLKKKN